jgi:hypothetical protein
MKLRIRGNSVRLRLTKSEVAEFAEFRLVENKTEFGSNQIFTYTLKSADSAENLQANFENGQLEIIIPGNVANNWINTQEAGISGETDFVKILIEKDFACLTAREGEDESDNFPHPKTDKLC